MTFPNTDTRNLRRTAGEFHLNLREAPAGALCAMCAAADCARRETPTDNRCADFEPVIAFSALEGLDLGAWAKRLDVGKVVAIADIVNRRIIRRMRVERIHLGSLRDVCDDHGQSNHVARAKGWRAPDVGARMFRLLRNVYGTRMTSETQESTVVYLRNIDNSSPMG